MLRLLVFVGLVGASWQLRPPAPSTTPVPVCDGPNEVWSPCPDDCLAESCTNVNDPLKVCNTLLYCRPRCICAEGYFRGTRQICSPADTCPGYEPCNNRCTPTCANPNPPKCEFWRTNTCCPGGYVLSKKGGKCIKIENCPKNVPCNGDPNAVVKKCPHPEPCASSCESPNAFLCRVACKEVGCECRPGFLLNSKGRCVRPRQCPGGNPCRKNEIFAICKDYCPHRFCSRLTGIACRPPNPCLSGCVCRRNYLWRNQNDRQCIRRRSCPRKSSPVPATYARQAESSPPFEGNDGDVDNFGDDDDDDNDDGDTEDDVDDDQDDDNE